MVEVAAHNVNRSPPAPSPCASGGFGLSHHDLMALKRRLYLPRDPLPPRRLTIIFCRAIRWLWISAARSILACRGRSPPCGAIQMKASGWCDPWPPATARQCWEEGLAFGGTPWHGEILLGRISLSLGWSQARERSLLSVQGSRDEGGPAWYALPLSLSTPVPPGELLAYWGGLLGWVVAAGCPSTRCASHRGLRPADCHDSGALWIRPRLSKSGH